MSYLIGIDGGGTRTTVAVADLGGEEILRRMGPAGLVDPRAPQVAASVLASLARQAVRDAGFAEPAAALCAGLAGVGSVREREVVRRALSAARLAANVRIVADGEIALEGAFQGGAGILLISGTGSIAYGRGEDGRVERCGGWGMVVGDEGSGYAIGRAALAAALRAADGRGPPSELLPGLLQRLALDDPYDIPPWAGRAAKREIAALAPDVVRLGGSGDATALEILKDAARELALHAAALVDRLAPWTAQPPIVFFGGVLQDPAFAELVTPEILARVPAGVRVQPAIEDAVRGAVRIAARQASA